jgi:hypothetical protein
MSNWRQEVSSHMQTNNNFIWKESKAAQLAVLSFLQLIRG